LKFYPEKCKGCRDCERACSKIHFGTEDGGDKSAIKIIENNGKYIMHVCNQNGLCIDMCPVGALERKPNGIVMLDKNTCIGCQACVAFCPLGAMRRSPERIQPFKCISCGACVRACPEKALELVEIELDEIKQVVYHSYHE
ncbi:MAG TPA: 4Fe-4S dicluster domain-containing protein, partial [Firmicutes bacterium]|nr:4Fe-4S dicluster domain-containing protein [Bacillota bacterium]